MNTDQPAQAHCFQLPNLPGTLEPIVADLARAGVNIESLVAHQGKLVMNVDRPATLREILRKRGIPYSEDPCERKEQRIENTAELADALDGLVQRITALSSRLRKPPRPVTALSPAIREQLRDLGVDLSSLAAL